MKNAFTVFKKDLRRVFTDPRMVLSLVLPGILIYVVYSLMGGWFEKNLSSTNVSNTVYNVAYTTNYGPNEKAPILLEKLDLYMATNPGEATNRVQYYPVSISDVEIGKQQVQVGTFNVLVVFTDDFESKVAQAPQQELANRIVIYYNGETAAGTQIHAIVRSLADTVYKNYAIDIGEDKLAVKTNLGKSDYTGTKVMSFIVPMLTTALLFSTVVSVCPDTIAGEKERGTLSAMLLTPIRRRDLVIGKIGAVLVTTLVSGSVTLGGLLASFPKLMGGVSLSLEFTAVLLLGALVISSLALFVTIGMLISTISKSVKECNSYLAPAMVVAMGASLLASAVGKSNLGVAFIPFLNTSVCMMGIIDTGEVAMAFFGLTILANLLYSAGLVLLIARLFHSERFTLN